LLQIGLLVATSGQHCPSAGPKGVFFNIFLHLEVF